MFTFQIVIALNWYRYAFQADWDPSAVTRVAARLNSISASDVLVESIESELFAFIDKPYIFPSEDEILRQAVEIDNHQLGKPSEGFVRPKPRGTVVVRGPFANHYEWFTDDELDGRYEVMFKEGPYTVFGLSAPHIGWLHQKKDPVIFAIGSNELEGRPPARPSDLGIR